jgi:uncharacterized protein (DUF1697 family)
MNRLSCVAMTAYVALVRGINVGGKNLIRMPALAAQFERLGATNVRTYIQSGNVLFEAKETARTLTRRIEEGLAKAFAYDASVVLRTRKQVQSIVENAPAGFGADPARYRYDVIFLKEPLTAAAAMKSVRTREGVDAVHAGRGVLYFSRLVARASQSLLSRLVSMPVYQQMTIRNWNTTTKLLARMETTARKR